MHTEIMRSLAIRHAPLFDQPHSLKLELACKLPSLHHAPPAPSKHLTRCLRNRVQAKMRIGFLKEIAITRRNLVTYVANEMGGVHTIPIGCPRIRTTLRSSRYFALSTIGR